MAGYMEEMTEKVKMRNEDTFGGSFPVRVYKVSTGWCQETHSHEYMQIWYVVSGSCTHIVEGAEYPLRAKNIFVIPPFVEHGLKDERDNFTIICCEFPAELITGDNLFDPAGRGLLRYTCIESFAAVLSRTRPCHTPGELSRVMLEQLLDEMLAEYDRRAEYYEIILKADVLKLLTLLARPRSHKFFSREGYIIVALAWVLLSAVGALPFWFSREIPSYADAFFETVSGFTTTGASILTDVEAMSHGLLFWRSFTHWVGGMGVLVFITMLSGSTDRSMNILKAEMPGPVKGKLTPRTRDTARVLYLLYFLITAVLVGMLLLGGMPLFDSLVHAFGTVGTGGFGIRADSIASYSPYIQGVITVFMILCGINFNLYYLLLLRQWRAALRSDELWTYLGLAVVATGVITLDLRGVYGGLGACLRQAAFQVSSVLTTTGYATADFDLWPGLSRAILFALLFIGGCAGSTAGGLKVSRAMILLRTIRREINRLVHPRRVTAVRCDGKALGSEVQRGVSIYFALYCLCILIAFLCLSGEPFSLETNLSAVVSCFNNVGPGLGAVGPAGSYAGYSVLSKLLLSAAMLMGRLEIYPMLVALSPSVWRKD